MTFSSRLLRASSALLLAATAAACSITQPVHRAPAPAVSAPTPAATPGDAAAEPLAAQRREATLAGPRTLLPMPKTAAIRGPDFIPIARDTSPKYQQFSENAWTRVGEQPISTFSAHVDTGSYANVRQYLARGKLPLKYAVRVEELVNYFDYGYEAPAAQDGEPLRVAVTVARSPWDAQRNLLRISMKSKSLDLANVPPANLVFLVDVSGSMQATQRLPLVKAALTMLANQLRPVDRVTIVTYASGTKVVLPPTAGDQKAVIRATIDSLRAAGATYGEGGLRMAYAQARQAFAPGGVNRVLLATDGDLNVGVTSTDALKALVESERERGISLTTLGVGAANYNEALMKRLANAGDGSYHYLDSLQEAHKVLVHQLTPALATVAKDVKLQVEFNPGTVDEYRLIGYDLHTLRRDEFNNDRVDAGDVGAGHTVTALYEFVPRGGKATVNPLRYTAPVEPAAGNASEYAWVKLRFKAPGDDASRLIEVPVRTAAAATTMEEADADFRFAAAVAGWGQWLRKSPLIGSWSAKDSLALARSGRGQDAEGQRAEFLRLVRISEQL